MTFGMELFVKAKHWHLFLIVIGIPFVLSMIANLLALSRTVDAEGVYHQDIGVPMVFLPWLAYYLWIWSAGMILGRYVKPADAHPVLFSWGLALSAVLSFGLLLYFILQTPSGGDNLNEVPVSQTSGAFYAALVLTTFISLSLLFLCLSHVAKTLVRAERKSSIRSADYFGEFIMALFFPIGIWLLQPRINALVEKKPS